jgi:hypothetical protein
MTARLLHERVRTELANHTEPAYSSVLLDPQYEAVGLVHADGSITAVIVFHPSGLILPWANTKEELVPLLTLIEALVDGSQLTAIVTDDHRDELEGLGFLPVAHTSGGHPVLQRTIEQENGVSKKHGE